jgi:glycosyltransferase involved in cell wall biosynthesis
MSSARPRPRVAAIVENAIQFYVPHYRQIAADGRLDLTVFYLTDRGEKPFTIGGATVVHERSVLKGYTWKRLDNWSPFKNSFGFLDNFDPQLCTELRRGEFTAAWFHGYSMASMWLGFGTCWRAGIPVLLRGESESFFRRPLVKRLAKHVLLGQLFRRVDAFLYIGQCNREFYKEYGAADERLFYVPYGVDNASFQPAPEVRARWRNEVRDELGLGPNTCVFIYSSKHREPKRPSDAVAAFCGLPPELDAALIMLGDGVLRPQAERVFRECGRGHRVFFLGSSRPYSELPRFLAAADVFVFTSIENWGMAINEALAAGLAVVSSDQVPGWFDMVSPGVNGFIYRAGFIPALTAHLRTLAENPRMVASMRQASMELASRFGLEQMTDGLVAAVDYVSEQPKTAFGVLRRS